MPTMTEYSVRPFATVPVDGDAADLLNAVGDALQADPRALGPVVGYDYERHQVDAIFQVDVTDERGLVGATAIARGTFNKALYRAGYGHDRTTAVTVVEGADPDQLP